MPTFAALFALRLRFLWAAAAIALMLIGLGLAKLPDPIAFRDTDEAMRLVQLRAFLAGQAWFDLVPHRLDPSVDVPMHWSRFVDLSLAALYWPLSWILPQADAERLMAMIWPAIMLVLCALSLAAIARRFGGHQAAFIVVILLAGLKTTIEFRAGRIDHHSAQMAVALVAIAATMARRNSASALLAGLATAFALSLGIETIPYLVILACFFAADFVRGLRLASVRAYSFTLAGAALALFLLTTAPRFYFYTACDALTLNVLTAVAGGGVMLGAAAGWYQDRETSRHQRLFLLCGIGVLAVAASLALEPRCLRGVIGPFDPAIRPLWFNQIQEIASIFTIALDQPEIVATEIFLPALALVVIATQGKRLIRRDDGQIMLACFAAAILVMIFQIRGGFYATMFALPFLAMAVAQWHRHYALLRSLRTGPLLASLAIVLSTYGPSFAISAMKSHFAKDVPVSIETAHESIVLPELDNACQTRASLRELAQVPTGLVLAPIDMGSFIMLETPHAVVSAPYHRFDRGIVLGQSILFMMDVKEAEAAIRQRGIDYIVICRDGKWPTLEEAYIRHTPNWLQALSGPDAHLAILKVKPLATAARSMGVHDHFAE